MRVLERLRRCSLQIATTALLLASSQIAAAHEIDDDALLPEQQGWRIGAAVNLALSDGNARWPRSRLGGVLDEGSNLERRDGRLALEQASLHAGLRLPRGFAALLQLGAHGREPAHVDRAQLRWERPLGPDRLRLSAGRGSPLQGSSLATGEPAGSFAQAALAHRAVFAESWRDDGLALAWLRQDVERGLRAAELGLWRARGSFPGAAAGPLAPSVRLHGGWQHWDLQLFAMQLKPRARGTAAQSLGSEAHSHGSLDCRASLLQRVCFEGRSRIVGSSLAWDSEDGRWRLALAGLLRQEEGLLYNASSSARYSGRSSGAWLNMGWRPRAGWALLARAERLQPRNHLEGQGAGQLADAAGLRPARALERLSLALQHQLRPDLALSLELGRETLGRGTEAALQHVALRLQWQAPALLEGRL